MKVKDLRRALDNCDPELKISVRDLLQQMEHDDFYVEQEADEVHLVIDR